MCYSIAYYITLYYITLNDTCLPKLPACRPVKRAVRLGAHTV